MKLPDALPDGYDISLFLENDYGTFKGLFYIYEDLIELNPSNSTNRRLESLKDEEHPFSWTIKNMTETNLEFVLNFSSPLEVSENI
jgi:hypothetical protein